jgi:hypothetical protein
MPSCKRASAHLAGDALLQKACDDKMISVLVQMSKMRTAKAPSALLCCPFICNMASATSGCALASGKARDASEFL